MNYQQQKITYSINICVMLTVIMQTMVLLWVLYLLYFLSNILNILFSQQQLKFKINCGFSVLVYICNHMIFLFLLKCEMNYFHLFVSGVKKNTSKTFIDLYDLCVNLNSLLLPELHHINMLITFIKFFSKFGN